jgi:hypothetical protein
MITNQTNAETPAADTRAWREQAWGRQPQTGRGGARPGSGRPRGAARRQETVAILAARHQREQKVMLKRHARELAALVAKLSVSPEAPAVTKPENTAPKRRPRGRPPGTNAIVMALRREAEAKRLGGADHG